MLCGDWGGARGNRKIEENTLTADDILPSWRRSTCRQTDGWVYHVASMSGRATKHSCTAGNHRECHIASGGEQMGGGVDDGYQPGD